MKWQANSKPWTELPEKLGATVDKPFTVLSFMSLAVIPELRVTDKGLVDVNKFSLTSVMIPD